MAGKSKNGDKTHKDSFSMPQSMWDRLTRRLNEHQFDGHSEYIRALFEAAEHYDLVATQIPKPFQRVLRRRSEVDPITGGWLKADEPNKQGPLRGRDEK